MKDNHTIEELKDKLINQFDENRVNYGESGLGGYIDDDFDSVFQCMVVVMKDLGIKVSE